MAYRRNKSLRDVIRDTTIKNNKVVRKQKAKLKGGYYKPCFSRTSNLCCKQVVPGTTFKSNVTLKTYQIFHQLNFKNIYIICLLECFKCQVQYVRKSETKLKRRTKTSINYFDIEEHSFNINCKFDTFPLKKTLRETSR